MRKGESSGYKLLYGTVYAPCKSLFLPALSWYKMFSITRCKLGVGSHVHFHCTYIAEYSSKFLICSWYYNNDDIKIENNSSQSNQVVEVGTGQSNQSAEI